MSKLLNAETNAAQDEAVQAESERRNPALHRTSTPGEARLQG